MKTMTITLATNNTARALKTIAATLIISLLALIPARAASRPISDFLSQQGTYCLGTDANGNPCNELNAFINQVNANVGNGRLSSDQGAQLLSLAAAIKLSIGC
jgi:hypothetical protein